MKALIAGFVLLVTLHTAAAEWPRAEDGSPLFVKGVTFTIRNRPDAPTAMEDALRDVRAMGATAIRTWGTGEETMALLDAAERQGLKVLLGLWLEHGRDGAEGDGDLNYAEHHERKEAQSLNVLAQVERYRHHPALLAWGVGNEVILNIPTEAQKTAYANYLESLCQRIRALDAEHPLISVSAWTSAVPYWEKHCPSLDAYGINAYGPGAGAVASALKDLGVRKPYLITEFGPRGTWDSPRDERGVAIMLPDPEKHRQIAQGWHDWIEGKRSEGCVGGFVFNYGDDWGPTSFLLDFFVRGQKRPGYWATREAFSGQKNPDLNLAVHGLMVSPATSPAGAWIHAGVEPLDGSALDGIRFYARHAIGARDFTNRIVPLEHEATKKLRVFRVLPPAEPGVYELYVHVPDAAGNLHIGQTSLRVGE